MNVFKMIKNKYYSVFKPYKYMEKIGVNFPKNGVHLYGQVDWGSEPWIITLGNNVYITNKVAFITHDGGTLLFRNEIPDLEITKPIVVGDNVYIGNNAIILPGVTIGNNVVIAAGTIVTKNVPNNVVFGGVPGRVLKTIEEYKEKITNESIHLGHLKGKEKDDALKKYYGYKGKSKGVYF